MSVADNYTALARLIAGDEAPLWLGVFLKRWAPAITEDHERDEARPISAKRVARIKELLETSTALHRSLSALPLIHIERRDPAIANFEGMLNAIVDKARLLMETLTDDRGNALAGRPKMDAPLTCAALIVEIWKFFHDREPAARNRTVAEAADTYWRIAGAKRWKSWGDDPLGRWRPWLGKAMNGEAVEMRRHCRETLKLEAQVAAMRGGK